MNPSVNYGVSGFEEGEAKWLFFAYEQNSPRYLRKHVGEFGDEDEGDTVVKESECTKLKKLLEH